MKIMAKNTETQNYEELSESQIFEKAKEELSPIQENLIEKKITIDEAKTELKKINEWIQWTKLEKKDKKEIWKAFEKLANLEKNIDEITLKNEVDELINLLKIITKRDLANLKKEIKSKETEDRPIEVQDWIEESSKNLDLTINDASEDKNIIAKRVGRAMKRLNS